MNIRKMLIGCIVSCCAYFCSLANGLPDNWQTVFMQVPNSYRSVPFWSWNYKVTKPEIDRMLIDFKENGFGGVFVHPRYGMETEYLSDEWFELYDYTIRRAEQLGLDIWIYDENAYPSGFAGGLLPYRMPESYTQGHSLLPIQTSSLPIDWEDYFVVLREQSDGYYQDIKAMASSFVGKPGNYFLYKKTYAADHTYPSRDWYAGFTYTDLLLPGVTDTFIKITMSGYSERFSSRFGKSVRGVFSDEVNIRPAKGFRWTPDLFACFQQRYGYDLQSHLPSLHLPVGLWKKIRYDYNKLLLELFVERWAKPWYDYCQINNLIWTGHYWEQTWPGIGQVPDNMALNAWQQMPGVDMLSNTFDEINTDAAFGNVRIVKEAKSAANQLGKKRVLCEAYGGGGWNMTFEDFKRNSDWLYAMGINFMNQHLSPMSFVGVRKYDWPPMFASFAPWWEDYGYLNEYNARLSWALSQGRERNPVLVWEPTATTWMYAQHQGSDGNQTAQSIGDAFQRFLVSLSKGQMEYDLGCESIIAYSGSVDSAGLRIGECLYKTIIIPEKVENMDGKCFELLKGFVLNGGRLITFSTPSYVDGEPSNEMANFIKQTGGIERLKSSVGVDWNCLFSDRPLRFLHLTGGNLFHYRSECAAGDMLFLSNASLAERTSFSFQIKGKKDVLELNAFDGMCYHYPSKESEGGLIVSGTVEPAGSLLLFLGKEKDRAWQKKQKITGGERLESIGKMQIRPLRENVLLIDHVDLYQGDSVWHRRYFMDANFDVFRQAGFPNGNPWFRAVQFKNNILSRDVSHAPGFRVVYSFSILPELEEKSDIKLLCERAALYAIHVNGKPVKTLGVPFLDKDFSLIPIGELLQDGKNEVELSLASFSVEAEIEPVYILGDFSVLAQERQWVIGAPRQGTLGSIREWGCPFYPWATDYEKIYEIHPEQDSHYYVSVPHWKGSVAQVWVNGEKAGLLLTEPYRLDISRQIQSGRNRVSVRVIGNMDNFIGPHHTDNREMAAPWEWQKSNGNGEPKQYVLSDYGLFDDFQLYQYQLDTE